MEFQKARARDSSERLAEVAHEVVPAHPWSRGDRHRQNRAAFLTVEKSRLILKSISMLIFARPLRAASSCVCALTLSRRPTCAIELSLLAMLGRGCGWWP